jgi:hypothetical protein
MKKFAVAFALLAAVAPAASFAGSLTAPADDDEVMVVPPASSSLGGAGAMMAVAGLAAVIAFVAADDTDPS